MQIGLEHYLTLAAILFTIGVFGIFLNRKNIIVILMSIELMLLAVNLNFIAFSHYLDSDETWKNAKGEEWSIPRLIREEIQAPINGAPCGGTHRLMGLSYAVRERQRQEAPVDGEFSRAATYVDDFHRYTFRLQNRDGSFSTEWFKRAAAKDDLDRRLQTSGHILEWLASSVPD